MDNHYHKPADVFREDWNFAGLAKMASFGYALGQAAAQSDFDIRWLPGDEFEKAWQKYQSGAVDTDELFAGHPELKIVHFEGILYPPLARQTRISGTVVAHVSVASDGRVSEARILNGHPLLVEAVEDVVKKWKFMPEAERTFELTCDFVISEEALGDTPEVLLCCGAVPSARSLQSGNGRDQHGRNLGSVSEGGTQYSCTVMRLCHDPSTTRPDAPNCSAQEKSGSLRSG